jgi:hypothetical protein
VNPSSPNSTTPLSSGTLNGQTLKIELVEAAKFPATIVISWPTKATTVPPANFDKAVAAAMRILSNAVVELAAFRVWKKL